MLKIGRMAVDGILFVCVAIATPLTIACAQLDVLLITIVFHPAATVTLLLVTVLELELAVMNCQTVVPFAPVKLAAALLYSTNMPSVIVVVFIFAELPT
jgi:hypothetical protein